MGGRAPGPLNEATNQVNVKQATACSRYAPVSRFHPGTTPLLCRVKGKPSDGAQRYRQFVLDAEQYGLPTRFLQYLLSANYNFKLTHAKGRSDNQVNLDSNQLVLTSIVMDNVKSLNPRAIGPESESIDTIYHESTHAFMDLVSEHGDSKWRTISKNGEVYYSRAPLKDGMKALSAERLFNEAAAMYVGWRASHWWERYESLTYMALKIDKGETPYQEIPKILDFQRTLYNKHMAERIFGYVEQPALAKGEIFGSSQIETTKKISDELKNFLDQELLEGKIPDDFDQVPGFRKLIIGLGMDYSLR